MLLLECSKERVRWRLCLVCEDQLRRRLHRGELSCICGQVPRHRRQLRVVVLQSPAAEAQRQASKPCSTTRHHPCLCRRLLPDPRHHGWPTDPWANRCCSHLRRAEYPGGEGDRASTQLSLRCASRTSRAALVGSTFRTNRPSSPASSKTLHERRQSAMHSRPSLSWHRTRRNPPSCQASSPATRKSSSPCSTARNPSLEQLRAQAVTACKPGHRGWGQKWIGWRRL